MSQLGIDVALVQPGAHPTQLWDSAIQPSNTARSAEYGDVGEIHSAMFSSADAPNPQDVASTIATLIATPKGKRAARTIVGAPFGCDTLNEVAEAAQMQLVDALGPGYLASVKTN